MAINLSQITTEALATLRQIEGYIQGMFNSSWASIAPEIITYGKDNLNRLIRIGQFVVDKQLTPEEALTYLQNEPKIILIQLTSVEQQIAGDLDKAVSDISGIFGTFVSNIAIDLGA